MGSVAKGEVRARGTTQRPVAELARSQVLASTYLQQAGAGMEHLPHYMGGKPKKISSFRSGPTMPTGYALQVVLTLFRVCARAERQQHQGIQESSGDPTPPLTAMAGLPSRIFMSTQDGCKIWVNGPAVFMSRPRVVRACIFLITTSGGLSRLARLVPGDPCRS